MVLVVLVVPVVPVVLVDVGRRSGVGPRSRGYGPPVNESTTSSDLPDAAPTSPSAGGVAGTAAPAPLSTAAHVLATVCGVLLLCHTFPLVIGFVWFVFVLRRTGHRARDAWLLLVPVVNAVVLIRCVWRATAPTVTWSTRPELRSEPLAMWTSPARWFTELTGP